MKLIIEAEEKEITDIFNLIIKNALPFKKITLGPSETDDKEVVYRYINKRLGQDLQN